MINSVMYHITPRRHLPSIMIHGLIPGHRRGITCGQTKWKQVFLTNDPDYVLKNHAGEEWIRKNDPIILKIDVSKLNIEPVKYRDGATYTLSNFEYVTERIQPDRIEMKMDA